MLNMNASKLAQGTEGGAKTIDFNGVRLDVSHSSRRECRAPGAVRDLCQVAAQPKPAESWPSRSSAP